MCVSFPFLSTMPTFFLDTARPTFLNLNFNLNLSLRQAAGAKCTFFKHDTSPFLPAEAYAECTAARSALDSSLTLFHSSEWRRLHQFCFVLIHLCSRWPGESSARLSPFFFHVFVSQPWISFVFHDCASFWDLFDILAEVHRLSLGSLLPSHRFTREWCSWLCLIWPQFTCDF